MTVPSEEATAAREAARVRAAGGVEAYAEIGEAEYMAVLNQTMLLSQLVRNSEILDGLERAYQAADRSLSVAPFFDPTAFMRGQGALRQQMQLMRAVQDFRAKVREVMA